MSTSRTPADAKMKAKRAPRPRRVEPDLTPADMAHAARDLHRRLTWIVARLDEGYTEPSDDAKNWTKLTFTERPSTRVRHSKQASILEALAIFAERSVIDVRRESLGMFVASLALDLARAQIKASEVLQVFKRRQGIMPPASALELQGALADLRSEPAKWKSAYCILAKGADIWPLPDTRRGLRGDLKRLYGNTSRLRDGKRDRKSKP